MSAQEDFVRGQSAGLLRAAYLLTGDRTVAQDLAQETLVRVLLHWRKVERADDPTAYTRRVLLNVFLGSRRRAWTGEVPHAEPPDRTTAPEYDVVDARDALRRALLAMPPRQRAAVLLRHYEDRSEAETAALMGCSVGNVKALTSRGLALLRTTLQESHIDRTATP